MQHTKPSSLACRDQRTSSACRTTSRSACSRRSSRFSQLDTSQRRNLCRAEPSAQAPQQQLQSTPGSGSKPSHNVVCIGEALFDLIADQKGVPRDKVTSWSAYAGGAPCNVATALTRLGVPVTFVTALGDDERGTQLLDLCKERGVLMHAAQILKGVPTRDVYVVRDNDGDREFAGFGRPTESYSDCFLDANSIPAEEISAATVLVTGTLGLAYPGSRGALTRAADACRATGSSCRLIVDVNWRPVFWGDADQARVTVLEYLEKAALIKISDSDLEWLLGVGLEEAMGDPCKILDRFPAAMGVMVTAGARGATYCVHAGPKSSVSGTVESFKVDTVDTTGAGDAFTAGFIYKLLQAGSLEQLAADPHAMRAAVIFAAAAGALTTTRPGAIESQPTLKEVQALVKERVPEREQ